MTNVVVHDKHATRNMTNMTNVMVHDEHAIVRNFFCHLSAQEIRTLTGRFPTLYYPEEHICVACNACVEWEGLVNCDCCHDDAGCNECCITTSCCGCGVECCSSCVAGSCAICGQESCVECDVHQINCEQCGSNMVCVGCLQCSVCEWKVADDGS